MLPGGHAPLTGNGATANTGLVMASGQSTLTVLPGAPLRDPVSGAIIGDSPFMDSLIVIITIIFFAAGLAYGRGAGTITTSDEVLASITRLVHDLGVTVVMAETSTGMAANWPVWVARAK